MEPKQWNPKHPGIPIEWKQLGSGGNAIVWFDGKNAVKRLRPNAGNEPVRRFEREAALVAELSHEPQLAIVGTVEVRHREGELEIVLERYDGNLEDVIEDYAGQPAKAAAALLPIAETLASMSARQHPIHHRDIKPGNLLFRREEAGNRLALADFGCAYLGGDDRLTPANRAIGAWAYRPPEYSIGRIEKVSEKGDVFSLGKVLWAMVNGERGVVFPGPVWFTEEFDLAQQFPKLAQINQAMILIAQACQIREERRPTLTQFADGLRSISVPQKDEKNMKEEAYAAMLRAEAIREVEYEQRRAFATQFVRTMHQSFVAALTALRERYPKSALISAWDEEYKAHGQSVEALIDQVALRESDAPLINVFFRKAILETRFLPAQGGTGIRFMIALRDQTHQMPDSNFTCTGASDGLRASYNNTEGDHVEGIYLDTSIVDYLEGAALRQA